jgi:hypothetical protein
MSPGEQSVQIKHDFMDYGPKTRSLPTKSHKNRMTNRPSTDKYSMELTVGLVSDLQHWTQRRVLTLKVSRTDALNLFTPKPF